jgi:isatin hydrolase
MGAAAEQITARLAAGVKVVDLSLLIAEEFPSNWPTHVPFQQKIFNWFEDRPGEAADVTAALGPYQTRWMLIDDHTGTHFDAPTHFIPPPGSGLPNESAAGLLSGDKIPLEQLMGPAAVLDVTALSGHGRIGYSPPITAGMIASWEDEHRHLTRGDVVLFRTGWDQKYQPGPDGSGYARDVIAGAGTGGWPAPDVPALDLLLERGVRCIGIDAPSIGAVHDPVPVHVRGLSSGAVFIEGLANLAELPATGAHFLFLPVKVRGSTGGPGRAVGFCPGVPDD